MKIFTNNWSIVLSVIAFISLIVGMQYQIANIVAVNEQQAFEISEIKKVNKEYLTTLQQIQVDLAVVRTTLENIK